MVLQTPPQPIVTWEPLPDDYPLPDDPVENLQQPSLAAALTDALGANDRIRSEMLIGSNFGIVATVRKRIVVKAPDWFYVPQVQPVAEDVIRRSYTPNAEGAPVAIVMEFLSNEDGGELSIRSTPPYGKLHYYEQILQVPTYVTYDPYELSLEVRCLQDQHYQIQSANSDGRFWIPELQLFLGMWYGERLCQRSYWLRWWDSEGNLLLWSLEQAERERQRADQERQRADQERQRADQERQRSQILAAKLRELGIGPETLTEES
ncbi:MAG: Uma2 family endonuclease [Plectolyngbya sp. WJT66-NPBG17]|jgi:Uma2 family endonuclease|nr:Uma2 family endonuclease [Plectolyngbya sp. WJT66-NPBG17]MBW4528068.1 Uma2 family endonuclease [Phormidium tanganyikae FI6-MK23]